MGTVQCAEHGVQGRAIACQHTIASLYDEVPRGLYWTTTEEGDTNAYCSACEQYRVNAGGDWPDDCNDILKVQVLCMECFTRLKRLNGFN